MSDVRKRIEALPPELRQKLLATNGSILDIPEIPEQIKDLYKTTWEISIKAITDMAADRGAYIC